MHLRTTIQLLLAELALTWCLPSAATAQDTRHVVEPTIPPACQTLEARIGRAGLSIQFEDESKPDTARIQAAIDGCPEGRAVVLRRAAVRTDAFLSGPLTLKKGVVLVVDRGAFLYASRNPRDYDTAPGLCGTITTGGARGCKALLSAVDAPGAGIMGDGVIDGRGGETMLGKDISWWNLADRARAGGSHQAPRLVQLAHCDNFTLYRITLQNAAQFHVSYSGGDGLTAWGVKLLTPPRARNTDGIDPANSTNVTIAHCWISTGDDHVAIKAGAGPPTRHISIVHNHFYAGHGMSIGSETEGGASDILVSDLSIEGADNGLRIKSNNTRGGLVRGVTYEDVCIRDTPEPVVMETGYGDPNTKSAAGGARIPVYRDIALRNVRVEGAGRVTLEGFDDNHRLGIRFDNVVFDDPEQMRVAAAHADVRIGPGPFNLAARGEGVTVSGNAGAGAKNACSGKFADFPGH